MLYSADVPLRTCSLTHFSEWTHPMSFKASEFLGTVV